MMSIESYLRIFLVSYMPVTSRVVENEMFWRRNSLIGCRLWFSFLVQLFYNLKSYAMSKIHPSLVQDLNKLSIPVF